MAGVPVDRGWAWCVLFGSFMSMFFVVGGLKSMGIMFVYVVDHYHANAGLVGWIVGLMSFGLSVFAPFVTALGMKYSYRIMVISGSIIMSLGFFLAAFATNVYFIIAVMGTCLGLGNGFMYTPALIMVNQYFDRYRSIATGFVLAGGSIGQLVIPILIRYLLDEMGFSGYCTIYAGIILHACIGGLLLRPTSFYTAADQRKHAKDTQKKSHIDSFGKDRDTDHEGILLHNGVQYDDKVKIQGIKAKDSENNNDNKQSINIKRVTFRLEAEKKGIKSVSEESQKGCQARCEVLSDMFPKSVTTSCAFWILTFAVGFANGGYITLFFLLPSYAKELGASQQTAATLLAVAGLADLLGRVFGGVFNAFHIIPTAIFFALSLFLTSGSMTICLLLPGTPSLFCLSVMLGFFGGMYITLYPTAVMDAMGKERFPRALSCLVMCMGMVLLPLPSLFGEIKEIVGSYLPSMWICTIMMVIGGTFAMFEPLALKFDNRIYIDESACADTLATTKTGTSLNKSHTCEA